MQILTSVSDFFISSLDLDRLVIMQRKTLMVTFIDVFFVCLKTGLIYLHIHKNIFLRVNEIMNLTMSMPLYEICL